MNLKTIIGIFVAGAIGVVLGGWWNPFNFHRAQTAIPFSNKIGLIGNAYPPCPYSSGGPFRWPGAPQTTATPQPTYYYSGPDGAIIGCDGNPVGPFHYQGVVQTLSSKLSTAPSCLSTGSCQIDADMATGSASEPAPACPANAECFAFLSDGLTDVTDGGIKMAASGIVVVSNSVLGILSGMGGSYFKGAASATWQYPFTTCPQKGSCSVNIYIATALSPQVVTTTMVPQCAGTLECLAFNGSSMESVNYKQTVGAAMTIGMSPIIKPSSQPLKIQIPP